MRLPTPRALDVQGSISLVGKFSYVSEPLKLGDLKGNHFEIVLRNLTVPKPATATAAVSGQSEQKSSSISPTPDTNTTDTSTAASNDANSAGADDSSNNDAQSTAVAKNGSEPQDYAGNIQGTGADDDKSEEEIVEEGKRLKDIIDLRCTMVKEGGFINYFGLQRFGTGGAPTSEVGIAMLKEDWAGAVRLIMTPRLGENEATHDSKVCGKTLYCFVL